LSTPKGGHLGEHTPAYSVIVPEIEAGKRWIVMQSLNEHPPALIRQAVQPEVQANQGSVVAESSSDVPPPLSVDLYEAHTDVDLDILGMIRSHQVEIDHNRSRQYLFQNNFPIEICSSC